MKSVRFETRDRGFRFCYAGAAVLATWIGTLCASTTTGSVVSWGGGQPSAPATLTNVIAISTALDHSLALGSNGTVVAWGYDFDGQTDVPPDLDHVVGIAAGAFFSVALKSDGSVVAWGDNQFNQGQ